MLHRTGQLRTDFCTRLYIPSFSTDAESYEIQISETIRGVMVRIQMYQPWTSNLALSTIYKLPTNLHFWPSYGLLRSRSSYKITSETYPTHSFTALCSRNSTAQRPKPAFLISVGRAEGLYYHIYIQPEYQPSIYYQQLVEVGTAAATFLFLLLALLLLLLLLLLSEPGHFPLHHQHQQYIPISIQKRRTRRPRAQVKFIRTWESTIQVTY